MKITVTPEERDTIVDALQYTNFRVLADRINDQSYDPADDGPEVAILSVEA